MTPTRGRGRPGDLTAPASSTANPVMPRSARRRDDEQPQHPGCHRNWDNRFLMSAQPRRDPRDQELPHRPFSVAHTAPTGAGVRVLRPLRSGSARTFTPTPISACSTTTEKGSRKIRSALDRQRSFRDDVARVVNGAHTDKGGVAAAGVANVPVPMPAANETAHHVERNLLRTGALSQRAGAKPG